MTQTTAGYAERLGVPLRWWALATMFLATFLLAFLVAMPLEAAMTATGVLVVLTAGMFLAYGGARVSVADGVLHAGSAQIPVRFLGTPRALDREAVHRAAGVEADARAFLLLRVYAKGAVLVPLTDPADPTPYWLISTRHPAELAAALVAAGAGSGA